MQEEAKMRRQVSNQKAYEESRRQLFSDDRDTPESRWARREFVVCICCFNKNFKSDWLVLAYIQRMNVYKKTEFVFWHTLKGTFLLDWDWNKKLCCHKSLRRCCWQRTICLFVIGCLLRKLDVTWSGFLMHMFSNKLTRLNVSNYYCYSLRVLRDDSWPDCYAKSLKFDTNPPPSPAPGRIDSNQAVHKFWKPSCP